MDTLECTATKAVEHPALRAMFEARKRVFVDLLGWDVPILAGRYEIDQFDTADAVYLILLDPMGNHRASARLLHTVQSHILADLFPILCDGAVPRGQRIREITRFCIDPRLPRTERRQALNALVSALVDHALATGIDTYTAVANLPWFSQIARFGWQCRALGVSRAVRGEQLVALRIDIDTATPVSLSHSGIYGCADFDVWSGMERPQ